MRKTLAFLLNLLAIYLVATSAALRKALCSYAVDDQAFVLPVFRTVTIILPSDFNLTATSIGHSTIHPVGLSATRLFVHCEFSYGCVVKALLLTFRLKSRPDASPHQGPGQVKVGSCLRYADVVVLLQLLHGMHCQSHTCFLLTCLQVVAIPWVQTTDTLVGALHDFISLCKSRTSLHTIWNHHVKG